MPGSADADSKSGSTSVDYEILARLAEGGMAEIFLARARSVTGLERHVVLKRILPDRGTDPQWIQMFLDEAHLTGHLQHPNIAQLFDVGRIGDRLFFTMEYIHGEEVRELLNRTAALDTHIPLSIVIAIGAGVAAGLQHAHERVGVDGKPLGIVHRDVTPSNVMVSYDGAIKLVDFGIAKANLRASETQTGSVKGKVPYLSPEQCRSSRHTDHRTDVFALGILLWECCTSSRLFRRDTDYETMDAIVNEAAPPPSRVRPDVPAELDRVILAALEKDPDKRTASCAEIVEALDEIVRTRQLAIGTMHVRRYMRELFGTRPEPWRELEQLLDRRVTITSETAVDRPPPPVHDTVAFADTALMVADTFPATEPATFDGPTTPKGNKGPARPTVPSRPAASPTGHFTLDVPAQEVPLLMELRRKLEPAGPSLSGARTGLSVPPAPGTPDASAAIAYDKPGAPRTIPFEMPAKRPSLPPQEVIPAPQPPAPRAAPAAPAVATARNSRRLIGVAAVMSIAAVIAIAIVASRPSETTTPGDAGVLVTPVDNSKTSAEKARQTMQACDDEMTKADARISTRSECVVIACVVRDATRAQQWAVPLRAPYRNMAIAACEKAGIQLPAE